MSNTACKYYTERTLGWMMNNKVIVFLSVLSFCLFVSTLAMAGQKNRAVAELEELKSQTTLAPTAPTEAPTAAPTEPTEPTPAPTEPTPAPEEPTPAPTEKPDQ
ncbi:uncharacterized protein LOC142978765 [Anticarsia gemmatalis]|uniref:uncharacterized protein LOC142978765 n=1 Tax=Anticarsia gemmatalis TaxID=129554 RepID=UPI003F75F738